MATQMEDWPDFSLVSFIVGLFFCDCSDVEAPLPSASPSTKVQPSFLSLRTCVDENRVSEEARGGLSVLNVWAVGLSDELRCGCSAHSEAESGGLTLDSHYKS